MKVCLRRPRFRNLCQVIFCGTIVGVLTIWMTSHNNSTFDKSAKASTQRTDYRRFDMNIHKTGFLNYTIVEDAHPIASSDYFIPRENVVNPFNYKYEIKPKKPCPEDTFLVIMVCSVHSHTNVRSAIRDTWGSVARSGKWPGSDLSFKVKLLFLFGQSKIPSMKILLGQENRQYDDILQGSFQDSYSNLTLKTLMGLRYVAAVCPLVQYVLKADEDTFTHVQLLYQFLKEVHPVNSVVGHIYSNSFARRHGQWAVALESYPHQAYPHYAAGNTYVLSVDLIQCINNYSSYLPYLPIEDVFVTGIMSIVCRATLINLSGVTYWLEPPPSAEELMSGRKISANSVSPGLVREIWREFVKTKSD